MEVSLEPSLNEIRGRIESIIDPTLWSTAQWCAVAFGLQTSDAPPILGLVFKDKEAALAIFAGWRARFGEVDADEQIRVSVLTGVDRHRPDRYRVALGSNVDSMQTNKLTLTATRVQSMDPVNSKNLEAFCEAFALAGRYVLAPALLLADCVAPEFMLEQWIGKRSLSVRPLWQVGDNDLDLPVVRLGDQPVVPHDQVDPPVRRALAHLSAMAPRSPDLNDRFSAA